MISVLAACSLVVSIDTRPGQGQSRGRSKTVGVSKVKTTSSVREKPAEISLESSPAAFVSLQYGLIEPALKKLRRAGGNLIHDETVDQLIDLDRFAAQIASLDAVISTSGTVVHLAGALGVPCVVILDESSLTWPLFASRTPWYPNSVLVHRRWRAWPEVMKDAKLALSTMLLRKQPNQAAAS